MKRLFLLLAAGMLTTAACFSQTGETDQNSFPVWGQWNKLTKLQQGSAILTPLSTSNPEIVADKTARTLKIDFGTTAYGFEDVNVQFDGDQYFIKAKQNGSEFHFFCKIESDSVAQWRFVEDSTVNYTFTSAKNKFPTVNLLDRWYGVYEAKIVSNTDTLTYSLQFRPERCSMYRWTGNNGRANNARSCTLVTTGDENSVEVDIDGEGEKYVLYKSEGKYFLKGNVNPYSEESESSVELKKLK